MRRKWIVTLVLSFLQGLIMAKEQDCLTWAYDGDYLLLTCKLSRLSSVVSFKSPNGAIIGNCVYSGFIPKCNAFHGKMSLNMTTNETTLLISKSFRYLDGVWECFHDNNATKRSVSLKQGIINEVEVYLKGELKVHNQIYQHRLMCYSCWKPIKENVEFILNTVTADNVRFSENGCYHRRGECNPDECSCLSSRNIYTWTFKSPGLIFPLNFSCGMRFRDIKTEFVKYVYLMFNGEDYIEIMPPKTSIVQRLPDQTTPGRISTESSEAEPKGRILYIGISIVTVLVILSITTAGILLTRYRRQLIGKRRYKRGNEATSDDTDYLLEEKQEPVAHGEHPSSCGVCSGITSYAICMKCQIYFCETCSNDHRKKNTNHSVVQIINIFADPNINCHDCNEKEDLYICSKCQKKHILCRTCATKSPHEGHHMVLKSIVNQRNKLLSRDISTYTNTDLEANLLYKLDIPPDENPVRIRGISFLTDELIVIADYNNIKLKLFNISKMTSFIPLKYEPRGMVGMPDSKVAVTFSNERVIKIYDFNSFKPVVWKRVKLEGKPFSIAYHNNTFAVELNEGDEGYIVLLNTDGKRLYRIYLNNFVFFTGNTIRLALDVQMQRLYVSAMGKQEVICIDYKSKKVEWQVKAPSPRAVMVLPVKETSIFKENNIILASKQANTIYQMNIKKGRKGVCMDENQEIVSPRYMSYRKKENGFYFAIQVSDTVKIYHLYEKSVTLPNQKLSSSNNS